ncbi:hypothetical protein ACQ4PT_010616 [Festuca glaucescens]
MSIEEEARAVNAKFWQVSQQEEVEAEAEEVTSARWMSECGEEDEPTTTNGGDHTAGDDTTTDGGNCTDDGSGNLAAKKKKKKERKDRKPTVLANTTDEITKVSESGLPLEPADVAAEYDMQLGRIIRESMSINTKHLRSEANERLVDNCLMKLHRRYTFPAEYKNMAKSNKVNKLAITKMSNALSSWRSQVKNKIEKGESWEKIRRGEPMLDEAEFEIFKAEMASDEAKSWTEWGQQMRDLNIGVHRLGSGGYRGKIPILAAEDAELERLGKPNPWLKIQDLQLRYFVWARYYLDKVTMEFITDDDDVRKFEEKLDEELKAARAEDLSSQGSTEPWDTTFNRATNAYKKRLKFEPPTSAGRVSGFGL